jgi:hypothetical protein
MHTDRLLLYSDHKGNLKGLPKFPPNKKVEAVFMVIEKPEPSTCLRRFPNREIAGKIQIKGNIFNTASEKDWNLAG